MKWSDDPILKLESLGQFLTPEERASLLEAENRALREKLSVSEEAIAFLQSHLMARESRSLQAEGQGRELAELWAAQSAIDERLQTLQDSQTGLVALFRREHERLTQAVNQEAARYLSNTLADSERALADAYARAPQLLLRGLADGNPRAFDEARRLVAEAQARSSEARRAAQESLENRLMTLQDSVTNLLTLFEREVEMMVSDVRSDLAASLPSAYNRRMVEQSDAARRQIAGVWPLTGQAAEPPESAAPEATELEQAQQEPGEQPAEAMAQPLEAEEAESLVEQAEAESAEDEHAEPPAPVIAEPASEEPEALTAEAPAEPFAEAQAEVTPEAAEHEPAEVTGDVLGEAEPPAPETVVSSVPLIAAEPAKAEPEAAGEQPGEAAPTTARMTPPAGIQVIRPLRPPLEEAAPHGEAPVVPMEGAPVVPEAALKAEEFSQPESAAKPIEEAPAEHAEAPAAETPAEIPAEEPVSQAVASPAAEIPAPAEPSPAAEPRRAVESVQACRIVVSPFPNFTVLIKFDEVLKKLPEIQRLRSRSFRAGRLEVALDCDSLQSLIESLERNTEVPLRLVSQTGDTLVFNLADAQIPAST